MIRLVETLEQQPHHPEGREMRRKVLTWLTEAPDVSVTICEQLLGIKDIDPGGPSGDLQSAVRVPHRGLSVHVLSCKLVRHIHGFDVSERQSSVWHPALLTAGLGPQLFDLIGSVY